VAKATRLGGASKSDGTQQRVVERIAGVDVELLGPDSDLNLGGRLTVGAVEILPGVVHDWTRDGWGPWRKQLVNEDATATLATQTESVVNGKGRISQSTADANLRVAYEREGTQWENSEVLALHLGADRYDTGGSNPATPQMGLFHRGQVDSTGRWRAVVVTNNIFLSDVNVVNQNVWNSVPGSPSSIALGTNGGQKSFANNELRRHARIRALQRLNFGGIVNNYLMDPSHAYGITTAEQVVMDADDNTFDVATATAPVGVDNIAGTVTMTDAEAGADVALKVGSGLMVPSSETARRYWPYWIRSQLVGFKLRVKVWRHMDPEPDWSVTVNLQTVDFAGAQNPSPGAVMPEGRGACGLIGAHLRNGRFMDYGYWGAWRLP
jgi:hypothetical protein